MSETLLVSTQAKISNMPQGKQAATNQRHCRIDEGRSMVMRPECCADQDQHARTDKHENLAIRMMLARQQHSNYAGWQNKPEQYAMEKLICKNGAAKHRKSNQHDRQCYAMHGTDSGNTDRAGIEKRLKTL
jgi:hypothetical protein